MGEPNFDSRTLYHGDNLDFLRGMNSETVHLIATDPPFNKNRDFHATPDSLAAGAKFSDRWRWDEDVHEEWTDSIIDDWPAVWEVITAARAAWGDDMGAFLCWLGVRLMEMHRVLRVDGSLYLHCDPTASHYLKAMLDAIFGRKQFRREIVWNLQTASGYKSQVKGFVRGHDIILYYAKSGKFYFDKQYLPHKPEYVRRFKKIDADGRQYRDDRPGGRRQYLDTTPGVLLTDVWSDIMSFQQASTISEFTGYPTQKPLSLYRRLIEASSNEDDIVLDPFCGCATTPVAAEQLKRQWIGMDIWDGARDIVLQRLQDEWLFTPEGVKAADAPPLFPHKVTIENTPPHSH